MTQSDAVGGVIVELEKQIKELQAATLNDHYQALPPVIVR
jgi:hypothetical protein